MAKLNEITAGCYEDNIKSFKMLNKLCFIRNEEDDSLEKNIFTGERTTQLAFRITYDDYIRRRK